MPKQPTDHQASEDNNNNNTAKVLSVRSFGHLNFHFLSKANALIYVALSRKKDSDFIMRCQLEWLHAQVVSLATSRVFDRLRNDPGFDLINEMWYGLPLLRRACVSAPKSPATFLNMYLPIRYEQQHTDLMEPNNVLKQRSQPDGIFFGVLFAERTVLTIFKGSKVILSAAGKFFSDIFNPRLMQIST